MRTAALAAALLAPPATGQTVAEVLSQIDGAEIEERGHFLVMPPVVRFRTESAGGFEVQLAVGREDLEALEQCESGPGENPYACSATVRAEIDASGSIVRLVVFEIRDLQRQ